MAIGTVEFDLSMVSPQSGEFLTARAYTVEGVKNADGSLRQLSIGQLVMAVCLERAARLERGVWDETQQKYVDGIIPLMEDMSLTSLQLELMTQIENEILAGTVNLDGKSLQYDDKSYTYKNFLTEIMGMSDVPTSANASSTDFISQLEAKMDEKNTFSQQSMIELQSLTNKRDQSYDMISNVLKSLNTTLVGNANNM